MHRIYTLPSMLFSGRLHKDEKGRKGGGEEEGEVGTRLSLRDRHRRHLTIINMTHNDTQHTGLKRASRSTRMRTWHT